MEIISFCHSIDKMDGEKEPDAPTHEQKEPSECDKIVNYLVDRTSSGDFYIWINTAMVKGKGRNDVRFSTAPTNLPVWCRIIEGNRKVELRIGTRKENIKEPRRKKKRMINGI